MRDRRGYTVVFDLDGTLIDTAPDLIAAVNHVLAGQGLQPIDDANLRPSISHGGRHMIRTALDLHNAHYDEPALDDLFARFLAYYRKNLANHSKPFPHLPEMLDRLASAGAGLAVCTNKIEDVARELLVELRMDTVFRAITGRDTFEVYKPHPEHLLRTIDRADGNRQRSLMIGDSNTDISTARAANVPVIGVTFGYTEVPVTELGCDAVLSHYRDLPEAVAKALPQ